MRLALVVQRYGLEVHGGSEYYARVWAERLAQRHTVTVYTTCARDYLTWADYYPPGETWLNGVRVLRFRVPEPRDMESFNAFAPKVFWYPHTLADEIEWMRRGGPYAPELFAAIAADQDQYDLYIFITYLYCHSYFGLPDVRHKAVLVPTAHDEPPIYLGIFRTLFSYPAYIIYNTPAERAFLGQLFELADTPGSEVGVGVELPDLADLPPPTSPPTLLYIGRIHPSKGCDLLYTYAVRYFAERTTELRLVLVGRADMELPAHPQIELAGFVSEAEKQHILQRCRALVIPSPFESLSIVTLEAWAAARPVLANGACAVLREQVIRSNGGLFYTSYAEFAACLDLLFDQPQLAQQMGQQGRQFVERYYSWPAVERRLEAALQTAYQTIHSGGHPVPLD